MNQSFSQRITLPYSALNATGTAKADWLLTTFQDVSAHHCNNLGISGFHMAPKNLKWVVAQYWLRIHSPLKWLESLTLDTSRAPWKNLYDVRRFTLSDPDGKIRVSATGVWVLIKADSGKPVRLSPNLPPALMEGESVDPQMVRSHPPLDRVSHETLFRVDFNDLDLNQHLNNTIYLKWALASMPHGFEYTPLECRLSFLKEAFLNQEVVCRVRREEISSGIKTIHSLCENRSGDELARISILWGNIRFKDPFNER